MAKDSNGNGQDERESKRQVAYKTLSEDKNVRHLSTALMAHKGDYGESPNSAMEQFKYMPAINGGATVTNPETGEEVGLIQQAIAGSRENGRYSGSVSEQRVMQSAYTIQSQAIDYVTVGDMLGLMNYQGDVDENYKDMYMGDLVTEDIQKKAQNGEELSDDEKKRAEIYQNVRQAYEARMTDTQVADALNQRSKQTVGGLEKTLSKPDDSQNQDNQ